MAFESSKVRSIRAAFRKHGKGQIKFVKFHGSEFTEAGTPDLIGCYRRICFVLECKNERGQLSPIQKVRLKEWKRAGAVTGVPRSAEDAVRIVIKSIDRDYQDQVKRPPSRHLRASRRVQGARVLRAGRQVAAR